jgi:hypothetical protein|tara:strand:- start:857 stop:1060 length:204 start_codon:yes stop_codon:yes gene_type:complete
MIPIEIEDAEKFLKESVKKIEHDYYYHPEQLEPIFRRSFYDINGKCLKCEKITQEEYYSHPRVGVWS